MSTHLVIPDVQCKPGVKTSHLTAIGNYIVAKKPDKIICLGDFFDMESLSIYDRGTKKAEGKNYLADIVAGQKAMDKLLAPINKFNKKKRKNKESYIDQGWSFCWATMRTA